MIWLVPTEKENVMWHHSNVKEWSMTCNLWCVTYGLQPMTYDLGRVIADIWRLTRTYLGSFCSIVARLIAFIHLDISSLLSAAKRYVRMLVCSAWKHIKMEK